MPAAAPTSNSARTRARGEFRIGISGWNYRPWRGTFYPTGLAQRRELEFASRQLNSIEINGSFYSLQTPTSYGRWFDETPDDFLFSVKGGRFITHLKRLQNVDTPLANFFASGVLRLGKKLGPILWQLPPSFHFQKEKLARFFDLLPRDAAAAAALARTHDERVRGRNWLEIDANRPVRHALEVRHASFATDEAMQLLREHEIALVVSDTAGKFPFLEDVTADFIYIRLHGAEELYVSGYDDASLQSWADKMSAWAAGKTPPQAASVATPMRDRKSGRDVFVYFDNDVKVRAPYDAMNLAFKLGVGPPPPPAPDAKTIDEVARTVWPSFSARAASASRWQFDRQKKSRRAATKKSSRTVKRRAAR